MYLFHACSVNIPVTIVSLLPHNCRLCYVLPGHTMPNLKYCRIIAVCVLFTGFLLAGWGASMSAFSGFAKNRYEHSTGKFLRKFSNTDQTYYHSLAIVLTVGNCFTALSKSLSSKRS